MATENLEKIPKTEELISETESVSGQSHEVEKEKKIEAQDLNKEIKTSEKEIELSDKSHKAKIVEPASEEDRQRAKQIDDILASGLNEIFLSLSPDKQKELKEKGEETVKKINKVLNKTKVNLGKIVKIIKKWLSIIPGVNRFFLEQEAKIKADKIIKLKKH